MSTHTPGPWRIEPPKGGLCAWTIEADRAVAFIARTIDRNAEEDANARLIALAPDMLNAIEKLVEMVDACRDDKVVPDGDEWPIEKARALLSLVGGQEAVK